MSYDTHCYNLAKSFLEDEYEEVPGKVIDELAQEIQKTIEDFIDFQAMKVKAEG